MKAFTSKLKAAGYTMEDWHNACMEAESLGCSLSNGGYGRYAGVCSLSMMYNDGDGKAIILRHKSRHPEHFIGHIAEIIAQFDGTRVEAEQYYASKDTDALVMLHWVSLANNEQESIRREYNHSDAYDNFKTVAHYAYSLSGPQVARK